MRVYIEFYETPPGYVEDLGRFMDDVKSVAAAGGRERRKVFDAVLMYLPKLAKMTSGDLLDHLATCRPWRWFDDRPIYRTSGEPCVLFSAFSVADGKHDDGESAGIRIYGLGVAQRLAILDDAEFEAMIRARCRSAGICG